MDGRHSFGGGGYEAGGDGVGRTNGQKQNDRAHFGSCTPVVGGSALTAAEGCAMVVIRTVARKKKRWHLDGAIAISLFVFACCEWFHQDRW
jgi:hypothetical protein